MTEPRPRFQTFDDPSHRKGPERISALRAALREAGLDGFVVPRADEHQSEYVPPNAERLAWLTGFTGSAGTAVILAEAAALVVDGRYTLQAPAQVETGVVSVVPLAEQTPEAWIAAHLGRDKVLGYDPWLHTPDGVERLERAAAKAGGSLRALPENPIDACWAGRPKAPAGRVVSHPESLAGMTAADKLTRIRAALVPDSCDALVISDPHNLAWAFNLRGADVGHTPLALGYAILPREGPARLYLASGDIDPGLRAALEPIAVIAPRVDLEEGLAALAGARVRLDGASAAIALKERIESAGGTVDVGKDPITAMKAVKNAAEIAGTRAAHLRDGASVTRFLAWLDGAAEAGGLTEIAAVEALEDVRAEGGELRDVSFPTISGSGPNGAIVHYRVTRETDRTVRPGSCSSSIPALNTWTAPPTSPAPWPSARRTRRCATATPAYSRGTSPSRGPSSPRAPPARRSTPSPAPPCGGRGSTSTTAPATGSASSSRCTRGRSASPRPGRWLWRPG